MTDKITANEPALAVTPGWDREGIARQRAEFDAVSALAEQWRRLSLTPIVDDDYPEVRHYYESAMRTLIDALRINRPEVFAPPVTKR